MKRDLTRRHLLAGGVGLVAGCGAPEPTSSPPQTLVLPPRATPAPSVAATAEPVRMAGGPWVLGACLSVVGAEGQLGEQALEGIQLAVAQANEAGGIKGRVVEARHEESAEVVRAMRTLDADEEVIAFIGDITSQKSVLAGQEANRVRVPMVTPTATAAEVTKTGPWMFRVAPIDPDQGTAAAELIIDVLRRRKIGILESNQPYSWVTADAFRAAVARRGDAQIVHEQGNHKPGSTFPDLNLFKKAGADVIFAPIFYDQLPALMKRAAAEKMPRDLFVGADGWSSAEIWKDIEGAHFLEQFMTDMPWKGTAPFVAAFTKRHGRAPTSLSALGFDATLAVLDALRRAKEDTREGVRAALAETKNLVGAAGPITFDRNRNPVKPFVAVRIENGKPVSRTLVGHPQLAHD